MKFLISLFRGILGIGSLIFSGNLIIQNRKNLLWNLLNNEVPVHFATVLLINKRTIKSSNMNNISFHSISLVR